MPLIGHLVVERRADLQPDFLGGNTFTAVVACKQTMPRTAAGACPPVLRCP